MKEDKCFTKYCRNEPSATVNGLLTCDEHMGEAFVKAAEEVNQ